MSTLIENSQSEKNHKCEKMNERVVENIDWRRRFMGRVDESRPFQNKSKLWSHYLCPIRGQNQDSFSVLDSSWR